MLSRLVIAADFGSPFDLSAIIAGILDFGIDVLCEPMGTRCVRGIVETRGGYRHWNHIQPLPLLVQVIVQVDNLMNRPRVNGDWPNGFGHGPFPFFCNFIHAAPQARCVDLGTGGQNSFHAFFSCPAATTSFSSWPSLLCKRPPGYGQGCCSHCLLL